jgi:hypothetical protein
VLIWAVGGAHNDLLLMLVLLAGVTSVAAGRPGVGVGVIATTVGIKAWTALIVPFALLGTRGARRVVAPILVLCAIAAVTLLGFGGHAFGFERELFAEQRSVAAHSVPNQLGLLIGLGGLTTGLRIVVLVSLVCAVGALMARVWRGADWLTSAGWATLCLLLCSAWLLPWYVVWVLPFAAVGNSPRLRTATLVFTCYVIASRIPPPFG